MANKSKLFTGSWTNKVIEEQDRRGRWTPKEGDDGKWLYSDNLSLKAPLGYKPKPVLTLDYINTVIVDKLQLQVKSGVEYILTHSHECEETDDKPGVIYCTYKPTKELVALP